MPFVIAIAGLKGGVGRTTVVANLAAAIAESGRGVLAIDVDPQDALAGHFATAVSAGGLGGTQSRGEKHHEAGAPGDAEIISFGAMGGESLLALEAKLASDSQWLRRWLGSVIPPGVEIVLLDTPAHKSAFLTRALEVADLVLAVITPDPAAYATLPAFEALVLKTRAGAGSDLGVNYVVNQFDAASSIGRDILSSLHWMFGERLAPVVIHRDEAVPEALGRNRKLVGDAPHSRALADIGELAEWILGLSDEKLPERRPFYVAGSRG
jgi:cellulose synthase operon protein YhjQ